MSEAKFTPGPWLLVEYENYCGDICCDIMCADNNQVVCEIPDYHLTRGKIQDSHLISAAPDLYAACSKALSAIDSTLDRPMSYKLAMDTLEVLSAALAKARGEL